MAPSRAALPPLNMHMSMYMDTRVTERTYTQRRMHSREKIQ